MHPGDPEHDTARRVWNALIDERPVAIACCRGVDDVVAAVRAARTAELPVSIRGGGHNVAGNAVRSGALLIDLAAMRGVPFLSSHGARWRDPADDDVMIDWVRETAARLDRHRCAGVYVNFVSEREGQVDEAYTTNRERLARIKRRYDPENLFRVNQNIAPAASGTA